VKDVLRLMVYGRLDDADCQPLDFIAAAKECGIRPDQMRRYLDRPAVRALLMQERRAFRAAICASNEAALLDVRNHSANGMARIAAVRALEQLGDDESGAPGAAASPGITIRILTAPSTPEPMVDVSPVRPLLRQIEREAEPAEPAFKPRSW
jgi:hypothetical protein